MSRLFIVYNESAGTGKSTKAAILDAFSASDLELNFVQIGDNFEEQIPSLAKDDILVAAGGDGTVNAVAQLAVQHAITMGVLPLGTLNHFAKDIGLPIEISQAAAIISKHSTKQIDYCTVNDRVFVNNSSIGIYPRTVRKREKLEGQVGKWPAAFIAAIRTAFKISATHLEFDFGDTKATYKTPMVFIGNNSYQYEELGFTNRTNLAGGKLFIYIIRANRLRGLLQVVALGLFGKLRSKDVLDEMHTELTIKSPKDILDVTVDGEVISLRPPLQYKMHPKALQICVP